MYMQQTVQKNESFYVLLASVGGKLMVAAVEFHTFIKTNDGIVVTQCLH